MHNVTADDLKYTFMTDDKGNNFPTCCKMDIARWEKNKATFLWGNLRFMSPPDGMCFFTALS